MIPGLQASVYPSNSLSLTASENNVDVFARLGSPAHRVDVRIYVGSGVVIGSSSPSNAAIKIDGFVSGSTFEIYNDAGGSSRIGGAGGAGGSGGKGDVSGFASTDRGGGGGGGAGTVVGAGGTVDLSDSSTATPGSDGTSSAGGAAGSNGLATTALYVAPGIGEAGGDAISCGSYAVTIYNAGGNIWGGGAGGSPGRSVFQFSLPTDGGGPGENTDENDGGYAVRGSNVTFVTGGSDPNVKGLVGP